MTTHQFPCSDIQTPDLRTAWPCSVGLQADVRCYDDEDIAGSLGDAKATISTRKLMQGLSKVAEWIYLVYRSTVE